MAETVYKVLSKAAYEAAARNGHFSGSPDDLRDGFIHLSGAHQLEGTLAKHFAGQAGLVLIALDAAMLGAALRWEVSRSGTKFPHLYAPLDLAAVLWVERLSLGPGDRHALPEGIFA